MTTQPRTRKNIDSLTAQELADYEHAFAKLQQISDADPDSIDGLTYFQNLHNTSLGPCEHANDTFLPWHRAHLFLFEEALRRSDPPRTANVALPYWDFSSLPTGTRYPKAFEDTDSILFHPGRNDTSVCRTADATNCEALPFPRQFLEDTALKKTQWSVPDSDDSLESFGGHAGGQMDCQSQFGAGFGALEEPPHNTMHSGFIGGSMAQPPEAAQDPIFFSFHCYLDLLWAQWQERFETNTDLDVRLCGLFKDREHLEENRFHVKDTLDTKAQFDYVYQYTPGEPAPPPPVTLFPIHPAFDVVASAHNKPEFVRTTVFNVPQTDVDKAALHFTDVNVTLPFSYGADIYLTPEGEELNTLDRSFRMRYLASTLSFWKAHHSHGANLHTLAVDLRDALAYLAGSHAGEKWVASVALTAVPDPGGQHGGHGHPHGHGHAAIAAENAADSMNFGELRFEIG